MADFWKDLVAKLAAVCRAVARAFVQQQAEKHSAGQTPGTRSAPRQTPPAAGGPKPAPRSSAPKPGPNSSTPRSRQETPATRRGPQTTPSKPGPASRPTPQAPANGRRVPAQVARNSQVAALQRRKLAYAPEPDGEADPGEIVWTWVPYEDDPSQGKDRPVLVVGRDGGNVFGLMLSSQDSRHGQRHWHALGPGEWDRDNRPSWVRLDRVLTVAEDGIRREGAVLDRARFDRVAAALRAEYGWH